MEASHYAVGGAGFVVLDEVYGANFFVEDLFVVAFEKVASGIFEDFWLYYYYAIYFCWDYFHVGQFYRVTGDSAGNKYFSEPQVRPPKQINQISEYLLQRSSLSTDHTGS